MADIPDPIASSKNKTPWIVGAIVLVVIVVGLVIWLVMRQRGGGGTSTSLLPLSGLQGRQTAVELKTEYTNPFDREAQYVNPFADYKSPFVNLQ